MVSRSRRETMAVLVPLMMVLFTSAVTTLIFGKRSCRRSSPHN